MTQITITVPEDQQDTPGYIFSSLMDNQGNPYREDDGRVHLYER